MQIKIQTDPTNNTRVQKRIKTLIEEIGEIKGVKKVSTQNEITNYINPLFGKTDKKYLKELTQSFSKYYQTKTSKKQ